MREAEFSNLIKTYLEGKANENEIKQVDDWYNSFEECEGFTTGMDRDELTGVINASFKTFKNRIN